MKINIDAHIASLDTSTSYWDYHMKQRKVKPLKKPCHDCAITTGFYVDMAEELKKEPIETVSAVVDTWFCHNHCNRGCAGVREYLNDDKR